MIWSAGPTPISAPWTSRAKELIFLVTLTVMRASKGHIQSHIQVALDLGVSAGEILEAIEIALPQAGIVAFQGGRGLG
jgi:4-carboxymuconolactone decarboxylase